MPARWPAFIIGAIAAFGFIASMTNDNPVAKATESLPEGFSSADPVGAASPLLRVIIGAGVKGNLKPGVKRYAPGTRIQFSFTPTPGHAAAIVVLDGKLVKPKGTINMNGDHYLWAFGNPEKGTAFKNVMTVPADVTKIPYPEFYQKTPSFSFNVADPYCAITSDVISYPTSYLGAFPMPPVVGAPLPPDIRRGVSLRDYWNDTQKYNPNLNEGCKGSMYTAFKESMKRFKRLGVDHVIIYQTAILNDVNATDYRFLAKDMWVSDKDLEWIVAQARVAGFKVHYYLLIGGDAKHNPLPDHPSPEWVSKFLDAWSDFIAGRAIVAQRLGIEALQLDYAAYWFDMTPLESVYVSKMMKLAKRVRRVFSGKTIAGPTYCPLSSMMFKDIDWAHLDLQYGGITKEDNNTLSVPVVKKYAQQYIDMLANRLGSDAPPVVWGIEPGSYRNYLFGGWLEDAFCTPSPENCTQRRTRTDFSVQAITWEASLETIMEQTSFKTVSVEAQGYWYTDVMFPRDSFPNLSFSFRNKPAESIVYEWFKR